MTQTDKETNGKTPGIEFGAFYPLNVAFGGNILLIFRIIK